MAGAIEKSRRSASPQHLYLCPPYRDISDVERIRYAGVARELLAAHPDHNRSPSAYDAELQTNRSSGRRLSPGRVLDRAGADPSRQAAEAFRLAYTRKPDSWEKDRSITFLSDSGRCLNERAAKGEKLALPSRLVDGVNPSDAAALVDLCLALINSNEFVYRF